MNEFETIESILNRPDTDGALQWSADYFRSQGKFHELAEVRKLQLRRQLGLPLSPSINDEHPLDETTQRALELGLVDIFREVGLAFLQQGDLEAGWSYLRFLPDRQVVREELKRTLVTDDNRETMIGLWLREGLDVPQGFQMVLDHYGTCNAITTIQHTLYGRSKQERRAAGNLLVRHVHRELLTNVLAHIERHTGTSVASESLAELFVDREWLFGDGSYHLDPSHLSSTVQIANELIDPTSLTLSLDLCRYGERLSKNLQYSGDPPFEDLYASHRLWFQAQLGVDVEVALTYFRERAYTTNAHQQGTFSIEVYIDLLDRVGRSAEALQVHHELIAAGMHTTGRAPTLIELSESMESFVELQSICKKQHDLFGYLLAGIRQIHRGAKIVFAFLPLLVCLHTPLRASAQTTKTAPDAEVKNDLDAGLCMRLDVAMEQAALYLVRHCRENGQFIYRVNTNPTVNVPERYNVIRHAGTIYALSEYYQHYPTPEIRKTLERAGQFLLSQVGKVEGVPAVQAVWSNPEISRENETRKASLGGTGLGLVALTSLARDRVLITDSQVFEELGIFLLFMQQPDGSYFSKYDPSGPGRDDSWTSLYYPGEAALGLLRLIELRRMQGANLDAEWLVGASQTLDYLARTRADQHQVPADHWILLATAELLRQKDLPTSIDRKRLEAHAEQICRQIVAELRTDPDRQPLDGRTTPVATRLEGLLAALEFFSRPEHESLAQEIRAVLPRSIEFLLDAQLREGPYQGGIPRAMEALSQDHPDWSSTYHERVTEIRVDYVQHALSAFLAYRRMLPTDSPAGRCGPPK